MSGLHKNAAGEALVLRHYRDYLQQWPVPHERQIVATRAGDTFVLSCGDPAAPPLVLLHGAMGNSATWAFDVASWASCFRVHCVDVIGEAGLSAPLRPPFTDSSYSDWLSELTNHLQLDRFSLVGESMGGWLALAFATVHPQRVERLALLCPAGVGRQKNFLAKVWPLLLLGPWGMRKVRELALGKVPAARDVGPELQRFLDLMALVFRHFRPRYINFPVFADEALSRLTMPLFAIVGGKDVFFDSAETARRLQANCQCAEIDLRVDAGHFLPARTTPILKFLLGD